MRGQVVCVLCVLVQVIGRVEVFIIVLTALPRRRGYPLQLVGRPSCIDYAVRWVAKNFRWHRCQKYHFDYRLVGMGAVKG